MKLEKGSFSKKNKCFKKYIKNFQKILKKNVWVFFEKKKKKKIHPKK